MEKIRKGDEIVVIAGRDKGKRGTVLPPGRADSHALLDPSRCSACHLQHAPEDVRNRRGAPDRPWGSGSRHLSYRRPGSQST